MLATTFPCVQDEHMEVLEKVKCTAGKRNLLVSDAPEEEDCLFHSVSFLLAHYGQNVKFSELRQVLADYLQTTTVCDKTHYMKLWLA